jgi:ferric-dicitrate binding protein FerR (iron transport regulator)
MHIHEDLATIFDQLKEIQEDNLSRERVLATIKSRIRSSRTTIPMAEPRSSYVPIWRRYAAAAAIITILVSGYFLMRTRSPGNLSANSGESVVKTEVGPGTDKAWLTLADGSKIALDHTTKNGRIFSSDHSKTEKLDSGLLRYTGQSDKRPIRTEYNVLTTPRAGQFTIILADGTKVWLNNASSLRYPTVFAGNDRVVELSGEGYFEVAGNVHSPFKVLSNGNLVTVLGTHFNVKSYKDDPTYEVTLLEGSVSLKHGESSSVLRPGEQAVVSQDSLGAMKILRNSDTAQAVAWLNGKFSFHIDNVGNVMRQLARWYDVDVAYEGSIPDIRLSGSISRKVNLSSVLQVLEISGVHCKMDSKRIIVLGK